MKLVLFALVLLLALTYGESLSCHRCVPANAGEDCTTTEERCPRGKDACATVDFLTAPFGHFQRCMKMKDCKMLQTNGFIKAQCCNKDFCN